MLLRDALGSGEIQNGPLDVTILWNCECQTFLGFVCWPSSVVASKGAKASKGGEEGDSTRCGPFLPWMKPVHASDIKDECSFFIRRQCNEINIKFIIKPTKPKAWLKAFWLCGLGIPVYLELEISYGH